MTLTLAWLLVAGGLVWVFQELLIFWDFHTQQSTVIKHGMVWKTKTLFCGWKRLADKSIKASLKLDGLQQRYVTHRTSLMVSQQPQQPCSDSIFQHSPALSRSQAPDFYLILPVSHCLTLSCLCFALAHYMVAFMAFHIIVNIIMESIVIIFSRIEISESCISCWTFWLQFIYTMFLSSYSFFLVASLRLIKMEKKLHGKEIAAIIYSDLNVSSEGSEI